MNFGFSSSFFTLKVDKFGMGLRNTVCMLDLLGTAFDVEAEDVVIGSCILFSIRDIWLPTVCKSKCNFLVLKLGLLIHQ